MVENVFLGHLKNKGWVLDWGKMREEAQTILSRLGLTASLDEKAGGLSVAEQQLIEIAKSLSRKSRLLIMDEPTASLSKDEVASLFEIVRSLKSEGIVTYSDGTQPTEAQMAKDVTTFLAWAAEPTLEQRHKMGVRVIIFLIIFTILVYLSMKRLWSRIDSEK